MGNKEGEKNIDELINDIKSKFGDESIQMMNNIKTVDIDVIPTGSLSLDFALGIGGIPRGRIIEIYGPEMSGKTTLSLHILAEAQNKGERVAFIDAEHALDIDYAKRIGVQIEEVLISQPSSGEEALQILEEMVKSRKLGVVVVDSVAALTPQAEIDAEIGESRPGAQARLMSQALRKLCSLVSRAGTTIIFLNQTRMKIGVMWGNPETVSGGMALKFYSSVRINLRKKKPIKQGKEIIGAHHSVKIVKNKVAAPFKTTELDIYYNEGISRTNDILNIGTEQGIIEKAGSWYKYEDKKLGQGLEAAGEKLKENPKIVEKIRKQLLNKLKEK